MFDFVRNLGKSADEKRQERLNAYVDGALSPAARQQFEQELAQDAALRFDSIAVESGLSLEQYMRSAWGGGAAMTNLRSTEINGRPAAVAEARFAGKPPLRVVDAVSVVAVGPHLLAANE